MTDKKTAFIEALTALIGFVFQGVIAIVIITVGLTMILLDRGGE